LKEARHKAAIQIKLEDHIQHEGNCEWEEKKGDRQKEGIKQTEGLNSSILMTCQELRATMSSTSCATCGENSEKRCDLLILDVALRSHHNCDVTMQPGLLHVQGCGISAHKGAHQKPEMCSQGSIFQETRTVKRGLFLLP
jgi:hypothetical protein